MCLYPARTEKLKIFKRTFKRKRHFLETRIFRSFGGPSLNAAPAFLSFLSSGTLPKFQDKLCSQYLWQHACDVLDDDVATVRGLAMGANLLSQT